jgi:Nickel responsive protein SCO4226-like
MDASPPAATLALSAENSVRSIILPRASVFRSEVLGASPGHTSGGRRPPENSSFRWQITPDRTFLTGKRLEAGMPLYMDTHRKVKGVTAAAVAEAHAKDLKVQGKHGVNYRNYWVDEKSEKIFCLVDAPSAEAAAKVHKEAHGLVADEIHEVHQG